MIHLRLKYTSGRSRRGHSKTPQGEEYPKDIAEALVSRFICFQSIIVTYMLYRKLWSEGRRPNAPTQRLHRMLDVERGHRGLLPRHERTAVNP